MSVASPHVDPERGCRRLSRACQWAAAAVAVSNLPRAELSWPWQAALLLPAALLALVAESPRRLLPRIGAAVLLQISACLVAFEFAGPLQRPAALAGTILPALAFVTVRRNGDPALGLFLCFCVLLVGTILDQPSPLRLAGFGLIAALQLRSETRRRVLRLCASVRRAPATGREPWLLGGAWLGAVCVVAVFAIDRTLALLPTPTAGQDGAAAAAPRGPLRAGLADTFDLGNNGSVLELRGERLVTVVSGDREPLPHDLYLRSGFFQVPGLASWQVGPLAPERRDASSSDWRLRVPLPGTAVHRLELTRLRGSRNAVFVPPGTCTILGVPDLLGDSGREWFRQQEGSRIDVYELLYQPLPPPPADLPVDPSWDRRGLLDVPPEIDRALFEPLLAEFAPRGAALDKARSIARGLQRRCSYERREPFGPYPHALGNFLHGERIGFCMHFASAAAILLRLSGVPCRIGVGLYGGTAEGDARVFGSQHSHAWIEIPITGRGWVVFDPTPPAQRGTPTADDAAAAGGSGEGDADAAPGLLEQLRAALLALAENAWVWLGVLVALLLPFGRPRRAASPVSVAARNARPARRWLLLILRELGRRGRPRPRGATLEQYAAALDALASCPPALRAAFATYQDVRFGGRAWDPEREQRMQLGLAAATALPEVAPAIVSGS
ncbi:MAG: transglutaminase family protein [Planctomycetota bacterium]